MQKVLQLISDYQKQHAGMSSFIDIQLANIQQALRDAEWREKEGESYWCSINLGIAEHQSAQTLKYVPGDGIVREMLVTIYKQISDISFQKRLGDQVG